MVVRRAGVCVLLALSVLACGTPRRGPQNPESGANRVEVFGRHACPICRGFEAELQEHGVGYAFYDVDDEPAQGERMWALLEAHHPQLHSVGLPVVLVNGTVLVRPDYDTFAGHLK